MNNLDRMKQLSGLHPQRAALVELKADRDAMIAAYDQLIRDVEQGHQLDEGMFDTLRATFATIGQMGANGAKAALDKTKQVSKEVADKAKTIYSDKMAKIELEKLVKNMQSVGETFVKMAKDSEHIIAKDSEIKQAMLTFDALFKKTAEIFQVRYALSKKAPERVEPTA